MTSWHNNVKWRIMSHWDTCGAVMTLGWIRKVPLKAFHCNGNTELDWVLILFIYLDIQMKYIWLDLALPTYICICCTCQLWWWEGEVVGEVVLGESWRWRLEPIIVYRQWVQSSPTTHYSPLSSHLTSVVNTNQTNINLNHQKEDKIFFSVNRNRLTLLYCWINISNSISF